MADVNPRTDVVFKKIFGIEENKDLTISLINSIVGPEDQVKDIVIKNPYNVGSFLKDKLSILDIKAEGHDGKRFNIEVQVNDENDYSKRALYYWAKLYTEQLSSGEHYEKLSKSIGIHILNFTSIPGTDKYHNCFQLKNEEGMHHFNEIELHTVELNKFEKNLPRDPEGIARKISNALDMWSSFLTRHNLLQQNKLPTAISELAGLEKAVSVLNHLSFTDEEREAYEGRLKWYRAQHDALKKQHEKGKQEGLAEGMEKGMEKGKEEVARNMLSEGLGVDVVARVTGLSPAQVQELQR